jgi:hypothetical protein
LAAACADTSRTWVVGAMTLDALMHRIQALDIEGLDACAVAFEFVGTEFPTARLGRDVERKVEETRTAGTNLGSQMHGQRTDDDVMGFDFGDIKMGDLAIHSQALLRCPFDRTRMAGDEPGGHASPSSSRSLSFLRSSFISTATTIGQQFLDGFGGGTFFFRRPITISVRGSGKRPRKVVILSVGAILASAQLLEALLHFALEVFDAAHVFAHRGQASLTLGFLALALGG